MVGIMISDILKDREEAIRLQALLRKLSDKIPEGADPRDYLSKKDRAACDYVLDRYSCGALPPLPPVSAFFEMRERFKADASSSANKSNEDR